MDRGDGEVEVTPDNYTDIFGDGTASFVLPKGKNFSTLRDSVDLTGKDILEFYSTGRLERYGCVFPNLKLKNADLTSVRLSEKYIGKSNPLYQRFYQSRFLPLLLTVLYNKKIALDRLTSQQSRAIPRS